MKDTFKINYINYIYLSSNTLNDFGEKGPCYQLMFLMFIINLCNYFLAIARLYSYFYCLHGQVELLLLLNFFVRERFNIMISSQW